MRFNGKKLSKNTRARESAKKRRAEYRLNRAYARFAGRSYLQPLRKPENKGTSIAAYLPNEENTPAKTPVKA
ncbi:MAG: hypothetical protein ACLR56_08875 [Oscillospiraceae bacterium]